MKDVVGVSYFETRIDSKFSKVFIYVIIVLFPAEV